MHNILKTHTATVILRDRLRAAVAFVNPRALHGKTTLNLGCGFGWFEKEIAPYGPKKMIGTDISEESIAIAQKELGSTKIQFSVGSAIDLQFPDSTFDAVFCWEVIEHIPPHTEQKLFDEVHRVLKKDGVFYLSTPHDAFWSKTLDPAYWLIGHRHYSIEKLHSYFGQNFRLQKAMVRGGWGFTLSLLNMYIAKWIFRRKMFFESTFQNWTDQEYLDSPGWANIFIKVQKK